MFNLIMTDTFLKVNLLGGVINLEIPYSQFIQEAQRHFTLEFIIFVKRFFN